jgi:hypothetical protein
MAAVEKPLHFGEGQLSSARTQFLGIFALKSDGCKQPVSDDQHHRPNFSKLSVSIGAAPISVPPR